MKLTFLGGAETVTGSKFLLEHGGTKILIDCGLFQGLKDLRVRNWASLPINPEDISAIILTHAHIDHSGYIPRLVRKGYHGKIYCTEPTRDLAGILLPDSGYLQEEDARYANRKGFSKHHPALPLYTEEEARKSLHQFQPVALHEDFNIGSFRIKFFSSGHILGASSILVEANAKKILFSGDLGRPNDPVIAAPETPPAADWVVMESTYGDENHDPVFPLELLKKLVEKMIDQNGVLLIPAFALGRSQLLLYYFYQLFSKNPALKIPVYMNSPMATEVTKLYYHQNKEHRLSERQTREMVQMATFIHSVDESKQLNRKKGPMVIISASGMLTGGRILHHIKNFAPDANNMILLAGYQAPGTRGNALLRGNPRIKIHGEQVAIEAKVEQLEASAHADQSELLNWLKKIQKPAKVFLVHGDNNALHTLQEKVEGDLKIPCEIAKYQQTIQLT